MDSTAARSAAEMREQFKAIPKDLRDANQAFSIRIWRGLSWLERAEGVPDLLRCVSGGYEAPIDEVGLAAGRIGTDLVVGIISAAVPSAVAASQRVHQGVPSWPDTAKRS